MNLKFYYKNENLSHGLFYFCFPDANNPSGYINIKKVQE